MADLLKALQTIAHGRFDNGRPLAAETARQVARDALTKAGIGWGKQSADTSVVMEAVDG